MSKKPTTRLGALSGKWNVPPPDKLKALLQPEREVDRSFYESDLHLPPRRTSTKKQGRQR